jgi:hypothetical protein
MPSRPAATHRAPEATRPRPRCPTVELLDTPTTARPSEASATGCRTSHQCSPPCERHDQTRAVPGPSVGRQRAAGPYSGRQTPTNVDANSQRMPWSESMRRAPTRKVTDESTCTPDFVRGGLSVAGGGHPSRRAVADMLLRPTRRLGRAALECLRRPAPRGAGLAWPCSGWGLPSHPGHPGCWWALTPPFHPYRHEAGGLFSVALSRGSPRVAVSNHPALWSPDVPRRCSREHRRDRPVDSSVVVPSYGRRPGRPRGPVDSSASWI